MQLLTAGTKQVIELMFAPDGQALVATSRSAVPRLWALPATGAGVPLHPRPVDYGFSLTFSPDSHVVGWLADHVRWEHDRRTGATAAVTLSDRDEWINSLVTCGADGRLVLRTTQHQVGAWVRAFAPDGAGGWSAAWAVGPTEIGGWLITGCRADRFFVWEERPYHERDRSNTLVARSAVTGEELARIRSPVRFARGLAATTDGSALVFFKDSALYCWRPGEQLVKTRTDTLRHFRSLAFHPDGRHLLAGNNDTTARLIDTESWQVVRQYAWDVGELSAVAVSPDGALAAAGGATGGVVVWDLDL